MVAKSKDSLKIYLENVNMIVCMPRYQFSLKSG